MKPACRDPRCGGPTASGLLVQIRALPTNACDAGGFSSFVLPGVWKGFIRKSTSEPGPKGTPRVREVRRRA